MAANLSYSRKRRASTSGGSSLKRAVSQVLMDEIKGPAPATVATVKRMIRATEELKYINEVPAAFGLGTTTPYQQWINALTVGANRNQRAGNRVFMKTLHLRVGMENGTAAPSRIRIMVIMDKQVNGVAPSTLLPFLGGGIAAPSTADLWRCPLNPAWVPSRFRILLDKTDVVGVQGGAANFSERKTYIKSIPIPKSVQVAQFNDGVAGTIADLNKNGLYLWIFTDYSGAVGTTPTITASTRLDYTDA